MHLVDLLILHANHLQDWRISSIARLLAHVDAKRSCCRLLVQSKFLSRATGVTEPGMQQASMWAMDNSHKDPQ